MRRPDGGDMTRWMAGLNILQVIATTTGGTGAHVSMLVDHLVAGEAHLTVCGPESVNAQFRFSARGAVYLAAPIGSHPHPRDMVTIQRLRRAAASADVVHAHSLRAAGLAGAATPRQVAFVVTRHNAILATGPARHLHEALQRYTSRRADVTLCVSDDLVATVRNAGGADVRRAVVTAPPMPAPKRSREAIRRELGAGNRPVVLAIGRLHRQKDYPTLIAAACRLGDLDPPPLVVIAGEGPERAVLEALITRTAAPVRLLGDRGDVADLLHGADVQVLSSIWEGTPMAVMEGLSAGLPFVGTQVGSVPDIVADAGLLVPPQDVGALAVELRHVLTDVELSQRLRERALRRAASLPSQVDVVNQVLGAYCAALRAVRSPPDAA